jgi:hypothetical protein
MRLPQVQSTDLAWAPEHGVRRTAETRGRQPRRYFFGAEGGEVMMRLDVCDWGRAPERVLLMG